MIFNKGKKLITEMVFFFKDENNEKTYVNGYILAINIVVKETTLCINSLMGNPFVPIVTIANKAANQDTKENGIGNAKNINRPIIIGFSRS